MAELPQLTQYSMNKKFIQSLITITKTRADLSRKVSLGAYSEQDRTLYRGKAEAYEEITFLLENLLK